MTSARERRVIQVGRGQSERSARCKENEMDTNRERKTKGEKKKARRNGKEIEYERESKS
ncbi:hypothetical protein DPMN_189720 [Dreissena polymorpha]|uniref:Uncharacterized protein n=1 Tax=Dreissena polymorpha TaxID=45954 RepID=A0A9D4IB28_DREPO|nr:hypothetical protein DPMN_189701 [Dreissena polymorpha]KAH3755039.1 hypothetical protein DPMN_189720 [Dreissena polymorpha]